MAAHHLVVHRAGIAALEGRTADAVEGFRDGLRAWREVGYGYWTAITELTMVTILDVPTSELDELARDARERFEAMGATPLIRQLDDVVAARATRPDKAEATPTGAVTAPETPAR